MEKIEQDDLSEIITVGFNNYLNTLLGYDYSGVRPNEVAELSKQIPSKYQDKIRQEERRAIADLMIKYAKSADGLPPRWVMELAINLKQGKGVNDES